MQTAHLAYVGCRTTRERNARGRGISVYRIDTDHRWHLLDVVDAGPNPSYLALDRTERFLYAVHGDRSEISAFSIGADGIPAHLATASTCGKNPVHLAVDPTNRFVLVANHLTSSIVVLPRRDDGSLGPVTCYRQISGELGPHRHEQFCPKPHQVLFDRTGRQVFVPDKGTDSILIYDFDPDTGLLSAHPSGTIRLREGSGPRTLALSGRGDHAFVAGEIDSTLTLGTIDASGHLVPRQVVSSIPDGVLGYNRAATVVLSDDQRSVFVSNRGHDSVCRFEFDGGTLRHPSWLPSGGKTPRFIVVEPSTGRLCIANEDSDAITLIPTDGSDVPHDSVPTPSPVCVVFSSIHMEHQTPGGTP